MFQRRLVLLLVLVGAIGWLLSSWFAITTITVKVPSRGGEIKAEVAKLLDTSWRQRNLITLDSGEVVSELQQIDPLIRSAELRRQWPHGVVVNVTLKQPSLGWSTGNQQYLLDRDGTAIGVLPPGSTLPVVVDGSNLPIKLGQRVASARFVSFAAAAVPAISSAGITVTGLSIQETTLDLTVTTNKGYRLVLDTGRTIEEEIVDLKAVLALLASKKGQPAEYIDLRIAGKAYYK